MTLIKKMAFGVLVMLLLVFVGTYLITMNNARNFFIQQMNSHAQDTATSLGLSLSQSLANNDVSTVDTMVQAIFDRGYYSEIEVKDIKGKRMVFKKQLPFKGAVPGWFVNLIKWPVMEKSALVMKGWMQAGTVSVTSNTGYAYVALWKNAIAMVKAYLVFAFIALILVYGFIQFLLKPLKRVTAQALAISEHEFPIEDHIPKTPELRQVTLAMNQMVAKVKSLFQNQLQQIESLRIQVYQDPLTGMNNRRYFLQQLSFILANEDEFIPGYLLIIDMDGLEALNQQQGYQEGDNLIQKIAHVCTEFWNRPSVSTIARIGGGSFALISNEREQLAFDNQCKTFEGLLRKIIKPNNVYTFHIGAAPYYAHQSVSNVLAAADLGVKKARELGEGYFYVEQDAVKSTNTFTAEELQNALQQKTISLLAQKVVDGKQYLHKELFVRMRNKEGEELGAGYFMPIAEHLGLAHLVDAYVLNELFIKKMTLKERVALNISEDTVLKYSKNYLQELKKLPKAVLKNLALEINESLIVSHYAAVKLFMFQVNQLGVKIGVDKVGIHFSPLHYLSELPIHYLKLHGSLVHDIAENESKQFLIHYFIEMAKIMDIQVVATQVEQEAQWEALKRIHVPWGQGRYLAAVEPLI